MRLDAGEGVEGDDAERDDDGRSDEAELPGEEAGAGGDVASAGASIVAVRGERIAEDGVGDKDKLASKAGFAKEGFESAAGDIGGHRDAGAGGAQAAGRLGDEEDIGIERAVRVAEDVDVVHRLAGEAAANGEGETSELGVHPRS